MKRPPRISLANLPTPLVRAERLSRELGGEVWIKRDDLTGLEVSGNKIRKLEYVLADARQMGCDAIVTEGTCQSNHCRATAAACARLGLHCTLLFRPEPPTAIQGNHLLDALFGAEWRAFPRPHYKAHKPSIVAQTLDALRARGLAPRWTPAGASEPLGCWGYIDALAELAEQLRAAGVGACDVVVGVSSDATFAGAILGKLLHALDQLDVWGVPVSDDDAYHAAETAALARATIQQFDLPISFDDRAIRLIPGFIGEGYAIPTSAGLDALRTLARTEAIVLDPVYTAKTFAAVMDGVRRGVLGRSRPVVFIHTGGIFSNFAWPERLLDGPEHA